MKSLLVPYYEHPAVRPAEWDALVAAAPRLYGVVLNPASGPGDRPDPEFAAVAGRLRAADVRVLGYVDTAYGRRPPGDVRRELARHRDWFGTDGVFLDQVAAAEAEFGYYRRLATAVRGPGGGTLVLNHGTAPHPSYARIADVLVTFEGTWATYRRKPPPPWTAPACACAISSTERLPTPTRWRGPGNGGPDCTARFPARETIPGAPCPTAWPRPVTAVISPARAPRARSSPPSPPGRRTHRR